MLSQPEDGAPPEESGTKRAAVAPASTFTSWRAERPLPSTATTWGPGARSETRSGLVPRSLPSTITRRPCGSVVTRSSPLVLAAGISTKCERRAPLASDTGTVRRDEPATSSRRCEPGESDSVTGVRPAGAPSTVTSAPCGLESTWTELSAAWRPGAKKRAPIATPPPIVAIASAATTAGVTRRGARVVSRRKGLRGGEGGSGGPCTSSGRPAGRLSDSAEGGVDGRSQSSRPVTGAGLRVGWTG